ncbi:endonuclease domain-containing protein [Sphingoaurantiacus capsulatus]|uniref:Endonuclease domain-containing protein n=1 Tax=Sphingoaurantiacus capsulatus TaxID=1771310 RepID=A0ABV7XF15_9SPHN
MARAADLRARLTPAEVRLWTALSRRRLNGTKFSRQIVVAGYICDFVCREHRLIVEVDGSQHFESRYDVVRDQRLVASGYRVLRFWNDEVLETLEDVLQRIAHALSDSPPLTPPPRGGETIEG